MPDHAASPDLADCGFFALRTPLEPIDAFFGWSADLTAAANVSDASQRGTSWAADVQILRSRLEGIVSRPEAREALFLASPSFAGQLDLWQGAIGSEKSLKIERALVRYFSRWSARATPFGLFGGCSVGKTGDETRLEIGPRAGSWRHSRLDMEYVVALAEAVAADPALRERLRWSPNSSLYRIAGHWRCSESRFDGRSRSYHLVALEDSEPLTAAIQAARGGATIAAIVGALVENGAPSDEAREFVEQLIGAQVLVSDLTPAVTGAEPLGRLAASLREHEAVSMAAALESVGAQLRGFDAAGPGVEPARYCGLSEQLANGPVAVDPQRLVQVDLFKPAPDATLGREVLDEVRRGIGILHRMTEKPGDSALARFRAAYTERYGEREMPLMEVLDEEIGIGYDVLKTPEAESSPLLAGLRFPARYNRDTAYEPRQAPLLKKLLEATTAGAESIDLSEDDLREMAAENTSLLPIALAAIVRVAANDGAALRAGRFQVYVDHVSGPSGACLLGRFCHGDPELHAAVKSHLAAEEALRPDAVFAELVHLPEGRVGNVLQRPVFREYEIPFLGQSGAPAERQIPLDDLRVSVRQGRVVLRSLRLDREVIPRLTTGHNYILGSLSVYRFLCSLQCQDQAGTLQWSWGPLEQAPFLPRVTSGRLVLSRAQWNLPADDLRSAAAAREAERFAEVQSWRAARRLPGHVVLQDGDNELLIDLDNALSVDSFVELVKGRPRFTLVECFPGPTAQPCTGPEGRYVHEMVVPFVHRTVETPPSARKAMPASTAPVRRTFAPGSEWLYVKIYTGHSTADAVLRDVIGPLTERFEAEGIIDRWFFLRYADPEWHLRVRFHGDVGRLLRDALPALEESLRGPIEEGWVSRLQVDTYDRELERYGGPAGIALCEEWFHHDSRAALAVLNASTDETRDARWKVALLGIDRLLADLRLDLPARAAIAARLRNRFAAEAGADAGFRRQIADRHRTERPGLERLLDERGEIDDRDFGAAREAFDARSRDASALVDRLLEAERTGRLATSVAELASSLIHMHVNRVLLSAHRAHEVVLYDFLSRLLESRQARRRCRTEA